MKLDAALEELADEISRHGASIEAASFLNREVFDVDKDVSAEALAPRIRRLEALRQCERVCLMVWENRDAIRKLIRKPDAEEAEGNGAIDN